MSEWLNVILSPNSLVLDSTKITSKQPSCFPKTWVGFLSPRDKYFLSSLVLLSSKIFNPHSLPICLYLWTPFSWVVMMSGSFPMLVGPSVLYSWPEGTRQMWQMWFSWNLHWAPLSAQQVISPKALSFALSTLVDARLGHELGPSLYKEWAMSLGQADNCGPYNNIFIKMVTFLSQYFISKQG